MPELVIFDWDGTLCDSTAHIVTAMQRAFREFADAVPSPTEVRAIIGLDLEHAIRRLVNADLAVQEPRGIAADIEQLAQAYRRHYAAIAERPQLYPGVREVLEQLEADGMMLAIATGKSGTGLRAALAETGTSAHFCALRTADDAAPKPGPGMVLDLLAELDTAAQCAVVVGDTSHDMAMAQAAGVRAIACTYGAHTRDHLLDSGAAHAITSIDELPALLAQFY